MEQEIYKTIIFDLDGTLIDSLADLADAANRALEQLDFPPHDRDAYRFFVGDGLTVLVSRIVPGSATEYQEQKIAELFKHYYERNWKETTRPYPGILKMLKWLASRSIELAVLSNKPDEFTQVYVNHFFPDIPFRIVYGQRPSIPKKPAPDAALEIAAALGCSPDQCLFVGDTHIDIGTGKAAGMTTMGVTWGFRGRAELEKSGADIIIDKPQQLIDHVSTDF